MLHIHLYVSAMPHPVCLLGMHVCKSGLMSCTELSALELCQRESFDAGDFVQ